MVVGFYGIDGLYNFGCEAIIRGTIKILDSICVNNNYVLFTPNVINDKKVLSDVNITLKDVGPNRNIFTRGINKLLQLSNINHRLFLYDQKKFYEGIDVMFSIGGDIYTIPKYIRKSSKYPYYNRLVQFGEFIYIKIPFIIWGASIGPFGDYKNALSYYVNHFKKIDLIVCREQLSIDYLKKLGVKKNVCIFPDPAFFVYGEACSDTKAEYIGLNLSPWSVYELYGEITEQVFNRVANVIKKILLNNELNILLIPHVVSLNHDLDNDYKFLLKVYDTIDNDLHSRIKLADPANGFLGIKQQLHKCKILIAARMHCAINAICENIPTIILSYSDKSLGMANFVYGNSDWVLSLENIETELCTKITKLLNVESTIKEYLQERIDQIRSLELYETECKKLKDVMNEKK